MRPFGHIRIGGLQAVCEPLDRPVRPTGDGLAEICREAAFLLPLIASYRGLSPSGLMNMLIAEEANRIGIAVLASDLDEFFRFGGARADAERGTLPVVSGKPLSGTGWGKAGAAPARKGN